ncbi:MAG: hypothetical protein ACREJC_22815 [Tepidisphaeraceae bacterium]
MQTVLLAILALLPISAKLDGADQPARVLRRDALFRVEFRDGLLRIEWRGEVPARDALRVRIVGCEAEWIVQTPPIQPRLPRDMTPDLEIECRAGKHPEADDYWLVTANSYSWKTALTGIRGGMTPWQVRCEFLQDANTAVLFVRDLSKRTNLRLQASDILEMRMQNPREVRAYLLPLVRQIAGEDLLLPGAADAYRVFQEVEPDPSTHARVEPIIRRLDDPRASERKQARRELADLPMRDTCFVVRMNPATLSPEQLSAIREFLSNRSRRTAAEPGELRRNCGFLADCLEFDDPRIRAAALREICILLARGLDFDVNASGRRLTGRADEIREMLSRRRLP